MLSTPQLPASQSSVTLTDDSQAQQPPILTHSNSNHLRQQHSLSNSASHASFNTAATATSTPAQKPFVNARTQVLNDDPPSLYESQGVHPTSTQPLHIHGPWFKDHTGRTVTLRGVNLSGASKTPVGCPSHQADGFLDKDGTEVSFVGRPFPLEDADEHLSRLKHWGFNFLRFIVTWESIEHAGPGKYDYEFFDYLVQVFRKCKKYGFKCFVDPHQDVWSRFTGGSGAPLWTLYLAGLDPNHFAKTNAALVHNFYEDPENFPKMVWATNYNKLAAATMFTLFFAGSTFAPKCVVDQMNIQDYLQTHYIKSYMAFAEYITAQYGIEDDVVVGYDTLNEPSAGWIGINDITKFPEHQDLKKDATPTPLQSMILGQGLSQSVEFWVSTFFGPKRKGSIVIDPEGTKAWLSPALRDEKDKRFGWTRSPNFPKAGECIWAAHGVWDPTTLQPLKQDYFKNDPETGGAFDFGHRSFLPFCRRYAQAVRTVHKAAIIFLEPPVMELPPSLPPPHDDDVAHFDINSRVVYAPHWYDGLTLINKKWNFFNVDILGVKRGRYPNYAAAVKIGEKAIKECFRDQLASIKEEGQAAMGQHPTIIGEIGIPYDMNDGKSYKPYGTYKDQIKAMDANMYALESNHLNFTLWNYCPDNSHKWGDQWNGEDLSLWSSDDRSKDPRRLAEKYSELMKNSSDSYNLFDMGDTSVDSPHLVRRTSSSLSVFDQNQSQDQGQVQGQSQGQEQDQRSSPVNTRLAKLSSPSTSSSNSLKSSSTASSNRPLISKLKEQKNLTTVGQYLDLGARALIAFCRPYAQKVAGTPLDLSFSLNTVTFTFSFKRVTMSEMDHRASRKVVEPTEIYLPRIHFPSAEDYIHSLDDSEKEQIMSSSIATWSTSSSTLNPAELACPVTVSAGRWEWKEEEQILYWWVDEEEEAIKKPDSPPNDDVYEITVVGKKWTGNNMKPRYKTSGSDDQCCRIC
ncbi:hypothetical protein BGZ94_003098 [Podila epigama]|nr:hypothetical protein BGZ94_003098 [Podila epigama]